MAGGEASAGAGQQDGTGGADQEFTAQVSTGQEAIVPGRTVQEATVQEADGPEAVSLAHPGENIRTAPFYCHRRLPAYDALTAGHGQTQLLRAPW
jgi:hypothetical protein